MKWSILLIFGVGVGVGYFLWVDDVGRDGPVPASQHETAVVESHGQDDAVKARVTRLRRQVSQMERRLGELESELKRARLKTRPGQAKLHEGQTTPSQPSSTQATTVEEGFLDALEADESPVREGVVQVIRDELANARAERREMRQAYRSARDEEHLEGFVKEAGLTEKQTEAVEGAMATERQRVGKLFREARENFDFRGARQQARSIHEETNEAVAEFLDEAQLEAWREMRDQRRHGPRR